jgi:outer membrane protein TolC
MTRLDKARQAYREAKAEASSAGKAIDNYQRALDEARNLWEAADQNVRATKREVLDALLAEDEPA